MREMRNYILLVCICLATVMKAEPLVVEDFDALPVGTTFVMWDRYNGPQTSTATVEQDPKNAANHVLHVVVKTWNTFPEFSVPSEYAGALLGKRFKSVRFRMLRPNSDTNDYKQVHIFYGDDQLYADNSYPFQGNRNEWQERSYDIGSNISDGSTATALRLGIHSDASEYYLDDITLVGALDDFVTYESGELNLCTKNTSSSYTTYTTPTYIPEGTALNLYTSRYTDLFAPFAGEGTLNIYAGGERTYLGEHTNKKYADWSLFTGDVHIYKYAEVEPSAGFYGIVMTHNGKTFSPENVAECVQTGKVCTSLSRNRVVLHADAAIAFENGNRAAQYGQLDTEAGSRIYGYCKATAGTGGYLLVGGNDADATMAGRIAPMEKDGAPLKTALVGIIKEGKGTYTLTANDNCISGGIRVMKGRVNICNDVMEAESQKLAGGTGTPANNAAVAYVMGGGVLGGTGNIGGIVDVFGTVEPGTTATGTLTIKDFATGEKAAVRMHPEGTLRFKIKDSEAYDQLYVDNEIELSSIKEDFTTSADSPRIKVYLATDHSVKVGDEFTLLTASERLNAEAWQWRMVFPSRYTWQAEERNIEGGRYALVVKVTALDDDPANAGNDEEEVNGGNEDNWTATFEDDGDANTLRHYADAKGLRIGVAVPTSRIAITNANDKQTKTITGEFNMVVPENELKFDWVEPSRNSFNYGDGDRLVSLAEANGQIMRGHTLAWHSQLPSWVSSDGKKNDKGWTKEQLMSILKNHIEKVVGHYKGHIVEWDVVNECLDDDQSIVRNTPDGYKLRQQSIWTTVCGEEFIDSAFVWVHRADPEAKLYLNDYGNEYMGNAKAQAFYNLVKRLQKDGRPIDGVGFQCHLDAGLADAKALESNIARYAELGLECTVTELDLGIRSNTESERQQQARDYYRIIEAAMAQPHCRSVLIWGLKDDISWRSSYPLLWNADLMRKPAYYAVRSVLRQYGEEGDAIEQTTTDSPVVSISYYTASGMRVSEPVTGQITIVKELFADGKSRVYKTLRRM